MIQDVESRVRGGHSFVQGRLKDVLIHAIDPYPSDLAENGVMIFD
jgi:hypothetical protein